MYKNTIKEILLRLENEIPIAKQEDLLETFNTLFLTKDAKNNKKINDNVITIPLAANKEYKKALQEEESPLTEIYKDFDRGDILRAVKVSDNKILVENLSIKEEYRKDFEIEKIDILKKSFNVIKRKSGDLLISLSKI